MRSTAGIIAALAAVAMQGNREVAAYNEAHPSRGLVPPMYGLTATGSGFGSGNARRKAWKLRTRRFNHHGCRA